MIIVTGIYRFGPKPTAFRNDFCLTCQSPNRSIQFRSFDAFHLFWIPILPLGFRKRWLCTVCRKEPRVSTKTRRPFKWIGLAILVLIAAVSWTVPDEPADVAFTWTMRLATPLAAVLLFIHLLRTRRDITISEQLASVPPASDTTCPYCSTPLLILTAQASCPKCGVLRL